MFDSESCKGVFTILRYRCLTQDVQSISVTYVPGAIQWPSSIFRSNSITNVLKGRKETSRGYIIIRERGCQCYEYHHLLSLYQIMLMFETDQLRGRNCGNGTAWITMSITAVAVLFWLCVEMHVAALWQETMRIFFKVR